MGARSDGAYGRDMTSPNPSREERRDHLAVRPLQPADRDAALDVLAQGMVDNPLHLSAYGPDPDRRVRSHRRLVAAGLEILDGTDVLCLDRAGDVVGVAGMARPGACQPTARQRMRLLPTLASLGPGAARRVTAWLTAWAERDPIEPHVHIGPVAIHPVLQGQGFGTVLMREVCARLDHQGAVGYLETDKWSNVPFYERCGFEVVGTADVIGVRNWFMVRRPVVASVDDAA